MTKTLLLDLDNILLVNDNSVFIPALIQAFSDYSADLIDPSELPTIFLLSTQAMMENRQPNKTLFEVLRDDFSFRSGLESTILEDRVYSFYNEIYPTLKGLTKPMADAHKFILEARQRGFRIALATNPLYPLTAVEQRLEWAGLSSDLFQPEVITSFEQFHFTKPSIAYFAEILAHMGWPNGDVIILGDDPQNDIEPAAKFGVPSFQVLNGDKPDESAGNQKSGSGSILDFFSWIDSAPEGALAADFEHPVALEAILRGTVAALDSLFRSSNEALLNHRQDTTEWNITEVICHLRDVEREVRLPRIEQVLEHSNPLITGKNTDEWADERGYCYQNARLAFHEFIDCRMKTLTLIESLNGDDWIRPARHTIFGPTDLRELVSIAATHDRLHLNQIWHIKQDFMTISSNQTLLNP